METVILKKPYRVIFKDSSIILKLEDVYIDTQMNADYQFAEFETKKELIDFINDNNLEFENE